MLDAHALVLVVSYRDIVIAPQSRHATEVAECVRNWLPLSMKIVAPDLLTVAVDGVEECNSNPASRLGWTRREVWQHLSVPFDWPQAGACELSSQNALAAVIDERAATRPHSGSRRPRHPRPPPQRPASHRDVAGDGRECDHQWWVSGHWRRYWWGPGRTRPEDRFIWPHLAGPDDKPVRGTERVQVWDR